MNSLSDDNIEYSLFAASGSPTLFAASGSPPMKKKASIFKATKTIHGEWQCRAVKRITESTNARRMPVSGVASLTDMPNSWNPVVALDNFAADGEWREAMNAFVSEWSEKRTQHLKKTTPDVFEFCDDPFIVMHNRETHHCDMLSHIPAFHMPGNSGL